MRAHAGVRMFVNSVSPRCSGVDASVIYLYMKPRSVCARVYRCHNALLLTCGYLGLNKRVPSRMNVVDKQDFDGSDMQSEYRQ